MNSISLIVCRVDLSKLPENTFRGDYTPADRDVAAVTWVPGEFASRRGLPRGSICGVLRDGAPSITPENFIPNRDFVDILHYLSANHLDPDLVAFAKRTPEKRIVVIDQRSPDINADIPSEDILGTYAVEKKRVVAYQANPNYRLVTDRGIFRLTPWLRKCLESSVLSQNG